MTSKARELANLGNAYSDGALSNRNLIINGAMQVAQRGTSHSVSAGYTLDRWFIASSVTATVTKEEDTVGGRKVSVIKSSASGSTYNAILQRIEGMRRIQGQTLTVSAWVKGAAGTETQYVEFRDSSGAVISNVTENFTFDGNWQKFEWTFEAPTNASFDNDAAWFNVSFYGGDELSVTMAQLEVGDTATPFEHRSYGDELARCQRYYWSGAVLSGYRYAQNIPVGPKQWPVYFSTPVSMRAFPSGTAGFVNYDAARDGGLQHITNSHGMLAMTSAYGGEYASCGWDVKLDAEL